MNDRGICFSEMLSDAFLHRVDPGRLGAGSWRLVLLRTTWWDFDWISAVFSAKGKRCQTGREQGEWRSAANQV